MKTILCIGAACVCVLEALTGTASAQNTTTRASVATNGGQGNKSSFSSRVSADGRFVVFVSSATNFLIEDTNNLEDIYVHDRVNNTTQRVSLGSLSAQALGGASSAPVISGDGRFVAFASNATNLVSDDTNGSKDVFVRDRVAASTTRVSVATGGGQASACCGSDAPAISADGRYVAFESAATNLVVGDTNGLADIFLHDRKTLTTLRVSVSSLSVQTMIGESSNPKISDDGRFVAFASSAPNLVPGDTNNGSDVFVRDVQTGTTTRVSVGPGGVQANGQSFSPDISGDGRFITFFTTASNLQSGTGGGLYVHDRQTGVTSALRAPQTGSSYPVGVYASISRNGDQVCVQELSAPGAANGILLIDRRTLSKTRLNVTANGALANDSAGACAINSDGTVVTFSSSATNLVSADTNDVSDVFVRTAFAAMALDKSLLVFGAATNGSTFTAHTAAQIARLSQSGVGSISWTAVSNQPWLQVTPASGTGSSTLSIGVTPAAGLPLSGTLNGEITVTLTGAVNTLPPIAVSLTLVPSGATKIPIGVVDTPLDGRTGVTGAVPFTGWAVDDIEVTRVSICRAAFGSEVAPIDPNCGGAAEVFVGFAIFIDGARPDVASAFPTYPMATRAGWGIMVLTNMLPNQGNGTYSFTMRAQDREGNWSVLGTRAMTCANASATLPFGTIDTPAQGGTASGTTYLNFGWALTPLPKTIPLDGSTIHVLIDGVDVGTADYNHARTDIQTLFPGLNNTNGAIGFRSLDTSLLDNGTHTISWTVTDNQAATEGLGSRYFTVSNGTSSVTAASTSARLTVGVDRLPLDSTRLAGRRGWDLEAPYGSFAAPANGQVVVRSEEVSRIELHLGDGDATGYLRTPGGFAPLPVGSRLDVATNIFTWAPGVGFVGQYDFVFVRSIDGRASSRREVRIILYPKGRGSVGPQVVVDLPKAHALVREPFMIGGWAADLDATADTGVSTLHAWAYPAVGGAPIFLGATVYGGARPDVAAVHGPQFKDSGFGLIVQGLPAGDYDLALFAWSTETMNFVPPGTVRVTVKP